ncbi:hypothetical protein [Apilactobacillus ozensis]|uniref:hypothetical protein n=1 Tax=Apilactobacillus ozensis TaxID=866801 RepID=UPI00200AD6D1|nr:hypothetical protein [Apilactobacillus ozensis]MCK8607254.1 hypothetical protein [Apilactobacillus ozensis]
MQTNDYRKTSKLVVANYVMLIVSCVPGFGTLLNFIGILDLAILILSSIILARRIVQSKVATWLAILGSAIHLVLSVTTFVSLATFFVKHINQMPIDNVTFGTNTTGVVMITIAIITWVLRVIAIALYTNGIFGKNKQV